jgi:hypothetical protein
VPCQTDLHPIWTTVGIAQISNGAADIPSGTLGKQHGFGAVFIADFLQALFANIKSLFPGNLLPFAFTPGSYSLRDAVHDRGDAHTGSAPSLWAYLALVPGVIFVALDFGKLTVLDHELKPQPPCELQPGDQAVVLTTLFLPFSMTLKLLKIIFDT